MNEWMNKLMNEFMFSFITVFFKLHVSQLSAPILCKTFEGMNYVLVTFAVPWKPRIQLNSQSSVVWPPGKQSKLGIENHSSHHLIITSPHTSLITLLSLFICINIPKQHILILWLYICTNKWMSCYIPHSVLHLFFLFYIFT